MGLSQDEVIQGLWKDRAKLLAYIDAIVLNRNLDLAEDIFQEVVILALKKSSEIESQAHLVGWARKAARFKAIDHLRRANLQPRHVSLEVLELLEHDWEAQWKNNTSTLVGALRTCLQKLTPRARKLIDMRYGDRLDGTKISQMLNIKVQSVYMALSRIYRTLENCIRRIEVAGSRENG